MTKVKKPKGRTGPDFQRVRNAIVRELVKMQESTGYIHDGWTGEALATWITPGIIRAVRRSLSPQGRQEEDMSGDYKDGDYFPSEEDAKMEEQARLRGDRPYPADRPALEAAQDGNSSGAGAASFDLLPCPFCGGTASPSIGKTADGKDWHYIECDTLGCGAIAEPDAWNQRATPGEQVAVVAGGEQVRSEASELPSPSAAKEEDRMRRALEKAAADLETIAESHREDANAIRGLLDEEDPDLERELEADIAEERSNTFAGIAANLRAALLLAGEKD